MENNLLIIVLCILLLTMAIYLRFIRKIPFINKENNNVDVMGVLSNTAVILTLFYAIFSYTHTVYPIFEKEQRLMTAEKRTQELINSLDLERISREALESKLDIKTQMYEDLSGSNVTLQKEKAKLEDDFRKLELTSKKNEREAVFNLIKFELQKIIDSDIHFDDINIKQELLKCANKNLENYKSETNEYKAYFILKVFSENDLNENSTWREALNIYTRFFDLYDNFQ